MNLAFKISILSFVGLLLGFINQLVIANFFGADIQRDIFFASFSVTNYIFLVINGSFLAIFLSYYIKIFEKEGEQASSKFILDTSIFLIGLLVVIIGSFFVSKFQFLKILFPDYKGEQFNLLKKIIIIQLLAVLFQTIGTLFSVLYQIKHRYYVFALFTLFTIVTNTIMVMLLSKRLGIVALPIASACSYGFAILYLAFNFQKLDIRFEIKTISIKNQNFINFLRISFPLFLSGIIFRFNTVFERYLTSQLPEGSVSYLGYANQILAMIATIVTTGLAVLVVPELARDWNKNNKSKMEADLSENIKTILIFLLFISVVMLSSGDTFIQILFERGKFNHGATLGVSMAFNYLIGALVFQSLGNIVVKILYLTEKSLVASIIGLIEIICYIILSLILVKNLSYKGVALATSISASVNIMLTILFIKKHGINLFNRGILEFLYKIIICCVLLYLGLRGVNAISFLFPIYIRAMLILVTSFCLYLVLLYIFRIKEAINIMNKMYLNLKAKLCKP